MGPPPGPTMVSTLAASMCQLMGKQAASNDGSAKYLPDTNFFVQSRAAIRLQGTVLMKSSTNHPLRYVAAIIRRSTMRVSLQGMSLLKLPCRDLAGWHCLGVININIVATRDGRVKACEDILGCVACRQSHLPVWHAGRNCRRVAALKVIVVSQNQKSSNPSGS